MSMIAKILEVTRVVRRDQKISDVKVDTGGGPNLIAENFTPSGDDSFPLTTDFALIEGVAGTGRAAVQGYVDPINEPKALEGEKRIYARDPADGSVVVEVWLKNDGTASILNENGSFTLNPDGSIKGLNGNGSFELQAGGDFLVNGVTIDTNGKISAPNIEVDGKELKNHTHGGVTTGAGSTGPNQ